MRLNLVGAIRILFRVPCNCSDPLCERRRDKWTTERWRCGTVRIHMGGYMTMGAASHPVYVPPRKAGANCCGMLLRARRFVCVLGINFY